jgi:hypothetical protein
MSTEFDIYKQNKINDVKKRYNTDMNRLYSNYLNNIKRVLSSRSSNKKKLADSLTSIYNNIIVMLKRNLDIEINKVNSLIPEFNVTNIKNKKALLIGINYIGSPYELYGCIDDANRVKDLLTKRGFSEIKILSEKNDIKPTKNVILDEFKKFIINANSGDVLFFYFSGHGSYILDKNNDETDGRDEMIVSSDIKGVLDDEFKNILSQNMKRDVTIVGLFDSCHSGTMFDLKFNYLDSNNYDKYSENIKASETNGNVIMISGCMDSQTSNEALIYNKVQGALTWSFIECINKTPNCSWRELLKSIRDLLKTNNFTQIPQMSTDSFYDIDSKLFI